VSTVDGRKRTFTLHFQAGEVTHPPNSVHRSWLSGW
jgi:hypothetical protein